MSHIPNSAMPRARVHAPADKRSRRIARTLTAWRDWTSERAVGLRDRARRDPRYAAAAAATALGFVAALAVPLLRRRAAA